MHRMQVILWGFSNFLLPPVRLKVLPLQWLLRHLQRPCWLSLKCRPILYPNCADVRVDLDTELLAPDKVAVESVRCNVLKMIK